MYKKYILKKDNERVYCIIDDQKPLQEEWERVFAIEKGYGLAADVEFGKVVVKNYYRGDNLASFEVLDIKDTDEEPIYQLMPMQD